MRYEIAQSNRLGNRKNNQDRISYMERGESVLLLLADGMGGYAGGEIAAELFVTKACQLFKDASLPINDPKKFLQAAFNFAHRSIIEWSRKNKAKTSPRTTGVACLVQDGKAYWAHLGDSRLYQFRHDEVLNRTSDHSVVEELIKRGELTENQREKHPRKNQVTRCLGGTDNMSTLTLSEGVELEEGDIILICSDGLWSAMSDEKIIDALSPKKSLGNSLADLSQSAEAVSYPNSDNISVISFKYLNNKPSLKQANEKNTEQTAADIEVDKATTQANMMVDEIQQALDKLDSMK